MSRVVSRLGEVETIEVQVEERDGWSVVSVRGEVDMLTAPTLKSSLQHMSTVEGTLVVLDLANVTFFDSSGLSVVVAGYKLLTANGGRLRIVTENPRINRVFEIAGLDRIIDMFSSVSDAVAA